MPQGTGCQLTLTHDGVLPEWRGPDPGRLGDAVGLPGPPARPVRLMVAARRASCLDGPPAFFPDRLTAAARRRYFTSRLLNQLVKYICRPTHSAPRFRPWPIRPAGAILGRLASGGDLGQRIGQAVRHDAAGHLQASQGAGAGGPDSPRPRRPSGAPASSRPGR